MKFRIVLLFLCFYFLSLSIFSQNGTIAVLINNNRFIFIKSTLQFYSDNKIIKEGIINENVTLKIKNTEYTFINNLLDIYKNDSSQNVRMEALKCLATLGSENFLKLLHTSVNDPAEFIRRVTVSWMGDIGLNEYLPLLATSMISDPSKRVRFNAKSAIQKIGPEKALKICSKSISSLPSSEYQKELLKSVTHSFKRTADWLNSELKLLIRDKSKPLKKRISAARRLRNYRFHQIIPDLINTALDKTDDLDLRIQVVETMGWFGLSFDNYDIVAVCNSIIDMTDSPEILKDMALMTKNRIVQGLNNPITP